MRTRSSSIILSVFALFVWGPSPVESSDSLEYLKRLLQRSAQSDSVSNNPRNEDGVVRIALRPDVNSSVAQKQTVKPPKSIPVKEETAEQRKAEAEAKRIESNVTRQIGTLQRQLEKEEATLDMRLKALGKQREAALAKNDEKLLKKIQAMEAAAVNEYERRVERVLATSAPKQGTRPVANNVKGKPTQPKSPTSSIKAGRDEPEKANKQPPRQPRKRRRRLWPFS